VTASVVENLVKVDEQTYVHRIAHSKTDQSGTEHNADADKPIVRPAAGGSHHLAGRFRPIDEIRAKSVIAGLGSKITRTSVGLMWIERLNFARVMSNSTNPYCGGLASAEVKLAQFAKRSWPTPSR
jgi:hypothetical protein